MLNRELDESVKSVFQSPLPAGDSGRVRYRMVRERLPMHVSVGDVVFQSQSHSMSMV